MSTRLARGNLREDRARWQGLPPVRRSKRRWLPLAAERAHGETEVRLSTARCFGVSRPREWVITLIREISLTVEMNLRSQPSDVAAGGWLLQHIQRTGGESLIGLE